jgi:hypothetical protein
LRAGAYLAAAFRHVVYETVDQRRRAGLQCRATPRTVKLLSAPGPEAVRNLRREEVAYIFFFFLGMTAGLLVGHFIG